MLAPARFESRTTTPRRLQNQHVDGTRICTSELENVFRRNESPPSWIFIYQWTPPSSRCGNSSAFGDGWRCEEGKTEESAGSNGGLEADCCEDLTIRTWSGGRERSRSWNRLVLPSLLSLMASWGVWDWEWEWRPAEIIASIDKVKVKFHEVSCYNLH